ncbi:MAG: SRPBCC family protein [Myxococcota bacterium]
MPSLNLVTDIEAPPSRCFDLSLSVDFHVSSMAHTGEAPVAGVTSGIMRLGDSVTWRAKHFGVTQRLTSKITRFEHPRMFRDSMVQGTFRRFDHDHIFEPAPNGTRMIDVFDYDAPLGLLGRLAERTFLNRYMLRLLQTRNAHLKAALEGDRWRAFLDSR